MNTESPRLRALMAAGAAMVVFGITIPATAAPDAPNPNRPGVGSVGKAGENANPPGQSINNPGGDGNNGFRCDDNKGAGAGNPALGTCDDGYGTETPPPTGTSEPNPPEPGDGDTGWTPGNT